MKPSYAASDKLIDRTRQVWQPRLGRDLSREDTRQIVENVTGFFALLAEWSRTDMQYSANHTCEGATPENVVSVSAKETLDAPTRGPA